MRKFKSLLCKGLAGLTALSCAPSSYARNASSSRDPGYELRKEVMSRSIQLSVTPRGQKFFTDHLSDVLLANGFALDDGEFAKWKYAAQEEINLDRLPLNMNGIRTTLGSLRDLIQRWLGQYRLNNPKFKIEISGIQYSAAFGHFGLRIDPKRTAELKRNNSVVMDLEIEITRLSASADKIALHDENNDALLGEMGIRSFNFQMRDQRPTLKFRVPLEISFDQAQGLAVRALSVQTNLPLVNIDWGYVRPLELPEFEITRKDPNTGKEIKISGINYAGFEDQLAARSGELAKALQMYLKTYLAESGGSVINGILEENHFSSLIEDVNHLDPLGAPEHRKVAQLVWGMVPSGLRLENGALKAEIDTFVEDTTAPRVAALPDARASAEPQLNGVSPESYDLSLSVDELFINRMLQLSFDRGYFSRIRHDGEIITLTEAPSFRLDSSLPGSNFAKLHVSIEQVYRPQTTWERIQAALAVHNPIHVAFDIVTRIHVDPDKGQLTLLWDQIDLNSVQLDRQSVKAGIFYKKVLAAVKTKLALVNKSVASGKEPLAPPFDVPHAVLGIPLRIQSVRADSSGHFNVFAELKK